MNYRIGSIIEYKSTCNQLRIVRVSDKLVDVKHGYSGFDAVILGKSEDDGGVWGYDDQIIRVVVR